MKGMNKQRQEQTSEYNLERETQRGFRKINPVDI